MVLGRRRRSWTGAAMVVAAALLVLGVAGLTRLGRSADPVAPGPGRTGDDTAAPGHEREREPGEPLAAGRSALVTVAVATVWAEPGVARPLDEPSLGDPVDMERWISAMDHDDKLWLVDHLVTQALYGEQVAVREVSGEWARVVVTGQPSSLDPNGYPGWMPVAQLRAGEPAAPAAGTSAVVTRPAASLRDADEPSRELLRLSYNTRLPVVRPGPAEVVVALPTGGRGLLAAADVEVQATAPRRVTGPELVEAARRFSGLPYLWAGTSSAGYDCSGLTAAVYGAHGIVLPRDAHDQAGAGIPVARSALQPGDLLFYSSGPDRRSIHHVSMYVGDGMMIQSPATGRTVETVPVDTPQLARQFWGARRYLPAGTT